MFIKNINFIQKLSRYITFPALIASNISEQFLAEKEHLISIVETSPMRPSKKYNY